MEQEQNMCFGIGNVLKAPLGLGRGVEVIVYKDNEGQPRQVACPFAIETSWGVVYCAAKHQKAIQDHQDGKDGSLSKVGSCFRVHPRRTK